MLEWWWLVRLLDVNSTGLKNIGELLGSTIAAVKVLSNDTQRLSLDDGRIVVLKRVPRQEARDWRPGEPWTELVALDFLSDEGLHVPKLFAADIRNGWLVREYVGGHPLGAPPSERVGSGGQAIVNTLVDSLHRMAHKFEAHRHELAGLRFWPLQPAADPLRWAHKLAGLLAPDARNVWFSLAQEAACGKLYLGPLDVQAANALWDGSKVWLLDWATVGEDYRERRVVGYAQAAESLPGTALDVGAYASYSARHGKKAARCLAFWDFAFWGVALLRVRAIGGAWADGSGPDSGAEAARRERRYAEMWRRHRLADLDLAAVQAGLRL